mmetsp:Transcript_3222/g.11243  ORF Transcript_3222/g.11243 Transcript_3222/m.11243 type:complete len:371 (+) Transcript_3222:784-1896(+)
MAVHLHAGEDTGGELSLENHLAPALGGVAHGNEVGEEEECARPQLLVEGRLRVAEETDLELHCRLQHVDGPHKAAPRLAGQRERRDERAHHGDDCEQVHLAAVRHLCLALAHARQLQRQQTEVTGGLQARGERERGGGGGRREDLGGNAADGLEGAVGVDVELEAAFVVAKAVLDHRHCVAHAHAEALRHCLAPEHRDNARAPVEQQQRHLGRGAHRDGRALHHARRHAPALHLRPPAARLECRQLCNGHAAGEEGARLLGGGERGEKAEGLAQPRRRSALLLVQPRQPVVAPEAVLHVLLGELPREESGGAEGAVEHSDRREGEEERRSLRRAVGGETHDGVPLQAAPLESLLRLVREAYPDRRGAVVQ